jgi:hypothetical protein
MRTVSIVLWNAQLSDVEACLAAAKFEQLDDQWNYPGGSDAVLYTSCKRFDWGEFPEEEADILKCTGGIRPTVMVTADVSGRAAGDAEVRYLVEELLTKFEGLAFDDYTGLEYGWTLEAIRTGRRVSGLQFFDYRGAHFQQQARDFPHRIPVKQGTFLYDGSVVCDVRVVQTEVCFGSGDSEDPPEVAEDRPGPCFYVEYGSTTKRGEYRAGSGGYGALEEAVAEAEKQVGKIDWLESP